MKRKLSTVPPMSVPPLMIVNVVPEYPIAPVPATAPTLTDVQGAGSAVAAGVAVKA